MADNREDWSQVRFWTPQEWAKAARVSPNVVYTLCTAGQLPSVKIGRSRRITVSPQEYARLTSGNAK